VLKRQTHLPPVELPAKPPQKSEGEQTKHAKLEVFAIDLCFQGFDEAILSGG
jgi:hypothetical protein